MIDMGYIKRTNLSMELRVYSKEKILSIKTIPEMVEDSYNHIKKFILNNF
jgi:hypothetical protein